VTRSGLGLASFACTVALATALVGGCFSERSDSGGPIGPGNGECRIPLDSPLIGATGAIIAIRNFEFQPTTVRVKPGTTVTWINCEPAGTDSHTSTSDDALWDSPFLEPGQTFSHTFGAAGSFDYFCIPHPTMRAVVIVE
jgi:plastocyanin